MIKVIAKVGLILDMFRSYKSHSLAEISERLGMKKPALHAVLKSLVELGYLTKTESGRYCLGDNLVSLLQYARKNDILLDAAAEVVDELHLKLKEKVNFSVIVDGERMTVIQSNCSQTVTVNDSFCEKASFTQTSTGMVLLAYQKEAGLKCILEQNGIEPDANLLNQLAGVRDKGFCVMDSDDGQAVFAAAPVFDAGNAICGALGCHIPRFRFSEIEGEVVEGLLAGARKMHRRLNNAKLAF